MRGLRTWMGASLIVFAFSERVFWSFWRTGDKPSELLITLIAYSLITAGALSAWRIYGVKSWPQVFLIGALVGWMAEGVVVNTVYGDATNPFPLSISFTGLSWHAILSVLAGLWWLPKALSGSDPWKRHATFLSVGVAWGLWAAYYRVEPSSEVLPTFENFATHTAFVLAMLGTGWGLLQGGETPRTKADPWILGLILALCASIFFTGWLPANPIAATVVLALFVGTFFVLRKGRQEEGAGWEAIPLSRLTAVFTCGAGALAVYGVIVAAGLTLPTNILLYLVSMPAGFILFFMAIVKVWRGTSLSAKPAPEPVSPAT